MTSRLPVVARCAQCWGLVCLLLAAPAIGDERAEYQQRLEQVERNIGQLQEQLGQARTERSELEDQLATAEARVAKLTKDIATTERALAQQQQRLKDLREEREALSRARDEQREHMAREMRAAYQLGQQSQLALLLNQESPERVARLLKYHDYFLADRNEKITEYLATLKRLDELEPAIAATVERLEDTRQSLASQHTKLEQRQGERQQALARLNRDIHEKGDELEQLDENRERLQALLEEIDTTMGGAPLPEDDEPIATREGALPWPTEGRVAHAFGSARAGGQMQWHGVMIHAPKGQTVSAVHRGRVVFADYFRSHGLLVILDHGNGYMSLYAHNQSLLKEPGEWVNAGEPIARVGNSGGQEETGLYFEIREQGRPRDPARWLNRG